MNKEVEELLQYLRVNISDEDEFIQISNLVNTIKQAFTDMEEELSKFKSRAKAHKDKAIEFNTKLDKIAEAISKNYDLNYDDWEERDANMYRLQEIEQILGDDVK